jgi:hypothetical protein
MSKCASLLAEQLLCVLTLGKYSLISNNHAYVENDGRWGMPKLNEVMVFVNVSGMNLRF